ncbi:hypothetical protein [Marinicrinis sediminis]|uniref:Uncharacterized protein n=1 Tax=Marinicrinis sediminis TaxID=1652465 RepID=A0ABW5R7L5_9BACL
MKWPLMMIIAGMLFLTVHGGGNSLTGVSRLEQTVAHSAPNRAFVPAANSQYEDHVAHWIQQIAKQAGFEAWQDATWTSDSLGAGMHSWLVEVKAESDGQAVGYLIVGADQAGDYRLLEYGLGPYTLFDTRLTQPYANAHGFDGKQGVWTRLYMRPLEALWMVELVEMVETEDTATKRKRTGLFDAYSGEYYDVSEEKLAGMLNGGESAGIPGMEATVEAALISREMKILRGSNQTCSDPFDHTPWVAEQPIQETEAGELETWLTKQPLTYTQRIVQDHILLVATVCGIHVWQDAHDTEAPEIRYWAVDHGGMRYVPARALQEKGSFYPSS